MANLVFVTVGTSVINNTAPAIGYESFFNELEGAPRSKSGDSDVLNFKNDVTIHLLQHYNGWASDRKTFCEKTSAELASLYHMKELNIMEPAHDKIVLLNSDTLIGEMAAEIIRDILIEKMGCNDVESVLLEGINARDANQFESTVGTGRDFIQGVMSEFLPTEKQFENHLICFSGGYKALIPLLTNFAKEKDMDMLMLHEQSDTLVRYHFLEQKLSLKVAKRTIRE